MANLDMDDSQVSIMSVDFFKIVSAPQDKNLTKEDINLNSCNLLIIDY